MTGRIYHPENKHPQEYQEDLNPHAAEGQNHGEGPQYGKMLDRCAYYIKDLHRRLSDEFDSDELRRIRVVQEGTRLEQGATYIDLAQEHPQEFTARADMIAGPESWYVPKSRMDYPLWNRLIGVTNPERLDKAHA